MQVGWERLQTQGGRLLELPTSSEEVPGVMGYSLEKAGFDQGRIPSGNNTKESFCSERL